MVPHRAHLFTFDLKVGIPHFSTGKIYWFKIFFCVTHRVHFFLPHRVQLVFWMVPHRAHLFTFYFKVGIPYFPTGNIYWFKIFFCVTHRVHFFLPHRVQLLFWMVPHHAHLFTFYLKFDIPKFAAEKKTFYLKYVMCYPSCAFFSATPCAVIILNGAPSSAPVFFLFMIYLIFLQ